MNSLKLTDFEPEQLRQLLRVVQREQAELKAHVAFITNNGCEGILQDAVMECNAQADNLELWATQLAQAIVTKEKENLVNLN